MKKLMRKMKALMMNVDLDEMAYTELMISIDIRCSSVKVIFSIIKGYKGRDYTEGNSTLTWDKLKKKFDHISAISLVKTGISFLQRKFEKGEN
jgi:hypothetical protein